MIEYDIILYYGDRERARLASGHSSNRPKRSRAYSSRRRFDSALMLEYGKAFQNGNSLPYNKVASPDTNSSKFIASWRLMLLAILSTLLFLCIHELI